MPTNANKSKSSLNVDCASREPFVNAKSCELENLAVKLDVITVTTRRKDHKRGIQQRPREMLAIGEVTLSSGDVVVAHCLHMNYLKSVDFNAYCACTHLGMVLKRH